MAIFPLGTCLPSQPPKPPIQGAILSVEGEAGEARIVTEKRIAVSRKRCVGINGMKEAQRKKRGGRSLRPPRLNKLNFRR